MEVVLKHPTNKLTTLSHFQLGQGGTRCQKLDFN